MEELKQEIEKKLSLTRSKKDFFVIKEDTKKNQENIITIGYQDFILRKIKGKKHAILPYDKLMTALSENTNEGKLKQIEGFEKQEDDSDYQVLALDQKC